MIAHTILDILAWLTSLSTLMILRRTWFSEHPVSDSGRPGYLAAILLGAGLGAWAFGTTNLWISGIPQSGRSIEGALFGAIAAVEIYKRVVGIAERTGSVYALPVALGIAVGRIGCQLSGLEDFTYGLPTGADWGWDFGDGINRHPVAFYESATMLVFAGLYVAFMLRGSVFMRQNGFYLAIAYYAGQRFVQEYFKPYGSLIAGLTLFQCLALVLLAYGLWMMASEPWMKHSTSD
jgi:prolipoprotein diacylglyceryltransferase